MILLEPAEEALVDPFIIVRQPAESTENVAPEPTRRATRRTSRGRNSSETDTAIVAPPDAPSKPSARRRSGSKPTFGVVGSGGIFDGMSDLALKSLTFTNTKRNQRYYASLETEIVRRNGNRPESPGMKIKSVAQREADERAERAARRARRGGGSGASDTAEAEDLEEPGDISMDGPVDLLPELMKHRRGAGEEEDYLTPVRGEPAAKRARFASVANTDTERRGVRWDRALFTEAWLDEVIPNPKSLKKAAGKGCLTPAAKVCSSHLYFTLMLMAFITEPTP
jgi:hypothetical protein